MTAKTMINGWVLAACLSAVLSSLALNASQAAEEHADDVVVLWDTQRVAPMGEVDFGGKKSWQRIVAGAAARPLSGDVVIENHRLAVVLPRRGTGPLVCPKSAFAQPKDASRLVPVAPRGQPATDVRSIDIRNNDEDEVVVEVLSCTSDSAEVRVTYRLARGEAFLECRPLGNAAGMRIEAATRFAVIPDFFGADMVFDPRAYGPSNLTIPPENFVLGLLEGGNTIVMSVWPAADQEAKLTLAGAEEARRIAAMEIGFRGKSVYVAVLHAPGIWHEHRLQEPKADRDIALPWNRPFAAKWRANFCCQRRNDSWDFQDRRTNAWMYLYQEIIWPCWFDGDRGLVRLSRRFLGVKGPMEFVLVYPADRKKDTPLTVLTPVDIVRNTLGVGPCEYVLDREGLQGRSANTGRKNFGRGVCDTTTPIEYLFIEGLETRETALVGHLLDDIQADIASIHARVLEFRRFAKDLNELAQSLSRDSASADQLLDVARKVAGEMESLYQAKLPIIKDPIRAEQAGRRIRQLASRPDPENLGECKTLTRELRDIAGTQHHMVGDYRVMVKRLRQEAGILGAEDPSTAKVAEAIRKLSGQVLRKKYSVEGE